MATESKRPGFLQRAIEQAVGKEQKFGRDDDPAVKKFPLLWGWLSTWEADKNNIKTPPGISIRLAPEGVLVSISDRDLARAVDVSCPHLEDVFKVMEAALGDPNCPVRIIGKGEPKIRKRKT